MPYPLFPPSPPPIFQPPPEKPAAPVFSLTTPPTTAVGGLLSQPLQPVLPAIAAVAPPRGNRQPQGDIPSLVPILIPAAPGDRAELLGPAIARQLMPRHDFNPASPPELLSPPFSAFQADPALLAQLSPGPAVPPQPLQPPSQPATAPPSSAPELPPPQPAPASFPLDPGAGEPIEFNADRAEYDQIRQAFTAIGDVLLRFREAELQADQLQTDLPRRTVVAEGKVSLKRGAQILEGERLEYDLILDRGTIFKPRGVIFLPSASEDFGGTRPQSIVADPLQPLPEELGRQPTPRVEKTVGIQRLRFEADRIEFTAQGWQAQNIRITSDPFSPPELELRADSARLQRISAFEDRVSARRPRLVFDQRIVVPIPRSQVTLSSRQRDPLGLELGIDGSDRGGLFLGRPFAPISGDRFRLVITPQFFLERAISTQNFDLTDADLYGGNLRVSSRLSPRSFLSGFVSLTSLDSEVINDNLRANLRLRQGIGQYTLDLESSFRDRLFNGSLGEQDVENSIGAVLTSPLYLLGNTGIELRFQASSQFITANTDDPDLSSPASLGRFQGSLSLRRSFNIWQGKTLPPTATAGLRYTATPVQPYLQLFTGLTGVSTYYSSNDTQQTLTGTIGVEGQIGHFSRPFLDYTGFNLSYSQVGLLSQSPFLFDRVVDFSILTAGILQQVYGPLRLGFQTSLNVETGELFNTDVILDYNRRTYGVTLRYSPTREFGSLVLRINGFNWVGNRGPFSSPEVGSVESGVILPRE